MVLKDAIKIGQYFTGLSLGEADMLRSAMSGKDKNNNKFFMIKELFLKNGKKPGHSMSWLTKHGVRWKALQGTVSIKRTLPAFL